MCITTSRWHTCCQSFYICTHFKDSIILQSLSVYQFDQPFFNLQNHLSWFPDSAIIFQTIVPRYLMPVLLKSNFTEGICKWWYYRSDIHCFFLNKVLDDCGTLSIDTQNIKRPMRYVLMFSTFIISSFLCTGSELVRFPACDKITTALFWSITSRFSLVL